MIWVYLTVLIFAALTLYFLCQDYRQKEIPKKAFFFVCSLEAAAMAVFVGLLIRSL